MSKKVKKPDSIKAMLDVSNLPPAIYARPNDGRKAKHLRGLRQRFAFKLASKADPDGSNIKLAASTLAKDLDISRRLVNYLFEDFRELKFLHDGGFDLFYKTRIRTLDIAAMKRAAANLAHVQNSGSPVQDRAPHVQNSSPEAPANPSILHTTALDSTAQSIPPSSPTTPAPQNGAAAKSEGREEKEENQHTTWEQFLAAVPIEMRNASQRMKCTPEEIQQQLARHGLNFMVGACRYWFVEAGNTNGLFETRAAKWRDFLDALPGYVSKKAEYAKRGADYIFEQTPEYIAAKAAAQEKLDEKTFAEMAFTLPHDEDDSDPLAGMR